MPGHTLQDVESASDNSAGTCGDDLRKDGSRIWANVTITALSDLSGTLLGFANVTQDLAERRAAEEDAQRFRLLVQSVKGYAIFILDPDGFVS